MPTPSPNPRGPALPKEIGGYQIQRVLGAGGMATVYAALQKQPRRTVALKVIKPGLILARGDAAFRRFHREIEILGKLHHPYIAQIYDAGTHDDGSGGTPYLVMEYVPGALTITDYIAAKQLDLRERLKLFVKVCAAMEHGHQHKVIHRDLKPANILIDQNGEPKIIDFGVAQAAELDLAQTMHTEAGHIIGTLHYMSPEQLGPQPQDLDARCDVYALGVMLYRFVTDRPPYQLEGLPVYEAVRVIREERPPRPSQIVPDLSADLETIVLKAIEHDRNRRYRNAGSLGRDIVRYLAHKPINARRASAAHRLRLFVRRHRTALTSGGIVAAVMSIALGLLLFERFRDGPRRGPVETQATNTAPSPAIDAPAPTVATPPPTAAPAPFTLKRHTGSITALTFLPGAPRMVSAAHDRQLILWDIPQRVPLKTVTIDAGPPRLLASSADGAWLAASASRGPVRLINADSDHVLNVTPDDEIVALALSPAADRLALARPDFTLRVHSTGVTAVNLVPSRNPPLLHTLRGAAGAFTAAAFSSDGRHIAAGSQRGAVYLWNASGGGGEEIARFGGLHERIVSVHFIERPDKQQHLLAIAADGSAMIWNVAGAAEASESFQAASGGVVDAALARDASLLAVATTRHVHLWDVSQSPPRSLGEPLTTGDAIHALAIDPAGAWLALGRGNGDIEILPRPRQ